MIDRTAGQPVLHAGAGPAGNIETAETDQKIGEKNDPQRNDKNAQRMHRLVRNDSVVDLQNGNRHRKGENVLGTGRRQKFRPVTAHGVETGNRVPNLLLLTQYHFVRSFRSE